MVQAAVLLVLLMALDALSALADGGSEEPAARP